QFVVIIYFLKIKVVMQISAFSSHTVKPGVKPASKMKPIAVQFPFISPTPFPPRNRMVPLQQDSKYTEVRRLEKILGLPGIPAFKFSDREMAPLILERLPRLGDKWKELETEYRVKGAHLFDSNRFQQKLKEIQEEITTLFSQGMPS